MIKALDTMLPRLEAEEDLRAIHAHQIGSGGLPRHVAGRAIDGLRRKSNGGKRRAIVAGPETLKSIGINVVMVPPSAATRSTEK